MIERFIEWFLALVVFAFNLAVIFLLVKGFLWLWKRFA